MTSPLQTVTRIGLGAAFLVTGTGHLTFVREEFEAQVPRWLPVGIDDTVLLSGAAELALGVALIALPNEQRRIGLAAAAFLAAVFPGNID